MKLKPWPGMAYRKVILLILFMPLLFLNNRSNHDWGDDFAQYIHQAKNIVSGIPQAETGFVYSQENYIGPTAYPAGFPLLLAPVYAIFGNQIAAFIFYISAFYFLLAWLLLKFYRKHFSEVASVVLTLIFIYNPQMLLFKEEVMSDIPFTVFLLLAFLVYPTIRPGNYTRIILFSVLTGFLIMVRSVGVVFLMAIVADQALGIIRQMKHLRLHQENKQISRDTLLLPLLLFLIPGFIYFLFNSIIFKIPSGGSLHDYLIFYYSGNFISMIPENLEQYVEVFRFMYTPAVGGFRFLALITGSAFLTMSVFGFYRKVSTRIDVFDLFFIFYILILLIFPNNYSAFRLLIPAGFLLLYYAALGFKSIQLPGLFKGSRRIWVPGALMIGMFLPGIILTVNGRNTILEGPQQPLAVEAFDHIRDNLPEESVVVFFKPRALALYTGRLGYADPFTENAVDIHVQLMQVNAAYILVHNGLTREPMKRYVKLMKHRVTEVWKNKQYRLYKINPPDPSERY